MASHFLTPARRRAAFALYAFCRVADDMVDEAAAGRVEDVERRLREYRDDLDTALLGRPRGPVFRELAAAARAYAVPAAVLHELLDGVTRDCAPVAYASWADLALYCKGVASSVGEMCTHVFGVHGDGTVRERALRHARILGLAMQLTNILRDVGEDARQGRCYLPADELARYGLSRAEVLAGGLAGDPRWTALMTFQVARARALYDQALPGIALLAAESRRCAMACVVGYAGILAAIERNGYDTFSTRARLGTAARAGVLWASWRGSRTLPAAAAAIDSRDGEVMRWA
ncbi:MAG: pys [Gemmatimonadetes bacterium]|nr:pys [Gemmatimonadota bacterium]